MKMNQLTPEEIENISVLLLSNSLSMQELGYELIKNNQDFIPNVLDELILICFLGDDSKLKTKVRNFLRKKYSESGEYEQWIKEWDIFKQIHNYRLVDKKELVLKHEAVRSRLMPKTAQNQEYCNRYYDLAIDLKTPLEKEPELVLQYFLTAEKGLSDNSSYWFSIAYHYHIALRDMANATLSYQKCLALNPNHAAANNNIGSILEHDEKGLTPERALPYYEKAIQLKPNSILYMNNLANVYLRLGRKAEYEELIAKIFEDEPLNNRALNSWCNYLWEHKHDYDAAEKTFTYALKNYPNDYSLLGNFGELYATVHKDYEKAFIHYKRAIEIKNSNYRLICMVSLLINNLDNLYEGLKYYKMLLNLNPGGPVKRDFYLNDLQWQEFLTAEEKLKVILNETDKISKLLLSESTENAELGFQLLKNKAEYKSILLHELILLCLFSPSPSLQNKLKAFFGRSYSADYKIWKLDWAIFKKLEPGCSKKEMEKMLKAHDIVRKMFEPFVIQNRHYADQYYKVAKILQESFGKHETALSYYDTAIKGNPNNKEAFFNKGYILHEFQNDKAGAKSCYEAALKIDPKYTMAKLWLKKLKSTS
jgi:tetratricopeptide (TPR) repeat protein